MNSFIYLYILETVRKNRFTSNATDSEICNVIRFRFAVDREGGWKKREERKKAAQKEKERDCDNSLTNDSQSD